MIRRLTRLPFLGLGAYLAAPAVVHACATCFGRSDSELAQGMNMGIVVLLGFILTVLTAIAAFIVHLARRSAAVARTATPGAGA